jgi:hypothetical protein
MGRISLWKSFGLVLTARCASVVKTALAQESAFSPRVVPNVVRNSLQMKYCEVKEIIVDVVIFRKITFNGN